MKKLIKLVIATLIFLGSTTLKAQSISKEYFGQNAWMPDTIGDINNCTAPPCVFKGNLHKKWGEIKASGASVIRFGGNAPDRNMPTYYQYLKMIDAIRANGMEPIIQVPFYMNKYSAKQAADIVKYLNITKERNIKYFVIGNEPDLAYKYTTASQVATYFKAFAKAMKEVDPNIITIGPEVAWYNEPIMNGITTPGGPDDITGKDANGRYYLDIISFHTYPFNGTQSRSEVITKLTASGSFEDDLTELNQRVDACNKYHNRTGASELKTAVTEANICFNNPANDNLNGVGANSFVGGQFWMEMLAIGMKKGLQFVNLWSVIEGNNISSNIGYIDNSTSQKKPTYYHFKMMSENFKGTFLDGTDNMPNVKSFGSQDEKQITVMILNQDQGADYKYTVKLNSSAVTGNSTLKINVNANVNKEYSGSIAHESTTLLVFDMAGNMVKKIEYSLSDHAAKNLAPVVTQNGVVTSLATENAAPDKNAGELAAFETKVYPNPAQGAFNFKMNTAGVEEKDIKMDVVNMVGQVVRTIQPKVNNGYINEKIDLEQSLAAGIYVVQVKIGDNAYNSKVMLTK